MLALNDDPVTIREIELAIADRGIGEGWVPLPLAARIRARASQSSAAARQGWPPPSS